MARLLLHGILLALTKTSRDVRALRHRRLGDCYCCHARAPCRRGAFAVVRRRSLLLGVEPSACLWILRSPADGRVGHCSLLVWPEEHASHPLAVCAVRTWLRRGAPRIRRAGNRRCTGWRHSGAFNCACAVFDHCLCDRYSRWPLPLLLESLALPRSAVGGSSEPAIPHTACFERCRRHAFSPVRRSVGAWRCV